MALDVNMVYRRFGETDVAEAYAAAAKRKVQLSALSMFYILVRNVTPAIVPVPRVSYGTLGSHTLESFFVFKECTRANSNSPSFNMQRQGNCYECRNWRLQDV